MNTKRSSGEAVAIVCLIGERYAHGNMVEVQLQLASADSPEPKIGDRYYLHPATPASAWKPKVEDFLRRLATMQPPNVLLQQITMLGEARDLLREAITPPTSTKVI